MADLLFIGVTVTAFALGVGFVRGCDRLIGSDSVHSETSPASRVSTDTRVGAR